MSNQDYGEKLIQARREALWRETRRLRRQRELDQWYGHRADQITYSLSVFVGCVAAAIVLWVLSWVLDMR